MEKEKKFYEKQWFMWLTLVFFAPVGIFLLWKYNRFSKNVRIAISAVSVLILISALASPDTNKNTTVSVDTLNSNAPTIKATTAPTPSPTLTEEQKAKIEEIRLKAESDAKIKKEKDDAEKAILAAKKAEEEKIGYETGITYKQLARTPDDFKGKKVKFSGKVMQVMEGDGETQLRIAVNDDYDSMLYVAYKSKITSIRILEKDSVTVKGLSAGLLTYKSTLGGDISIPSMLVEKIELNQ